MSVLSENDIKKVVQKVLIELGENKGKSEDRTYLLDKNKQKDFSQLKDITEIDLREQLMIENPENKDAYLKFKSTTTARVGIGRAGSRYKTQTQLRFKADHAIAQNAVFSDVSQEFLDEMKLFSVETMCKDKEEFLTRPDFGRKFEQKAIEKIKERCEKNPRVQIYLSDGLSSTAIEENGEDTLAAIKQGLIEDDIKVGTPFFVKYGRVPAMDMISEILKPEVTVVLIGERPGLATAGSMSCYMAYHAKVGMPEANRTVISNIHKEGTPAIEAGAHIADIIKRILKQKKSGLSLKT